MRLLTPLAIVSLLAAPAAQALADVRVYSAPFVQEGTGSPATGTGVLTVDTDTRDLTVSMTFSGLLGPTTVAHLHCCQASAGVGNAGVASQVPTFAGFPTGVTSGTYEQTFDMDLAANWNPSFVTNNGGTTASAFSALVAALDGGRAYLNIHSQAFQAGEIRAEVLPIPSAPEWAFAAAGLVAALARRRAAKGATGSRA
jgi:hypothetical protein